jgi:hypothetical protein
VLLGLVQLDYRLSILLLLVVVAVAVMVLLLMELVVLVDTDVACLVNPLVAIVVLKAQQALF